jgi:hypothetical protein
MTVTQASLDALAAHTRKRRDTVRARSTAIALSAREVRGFTLRRQVAGMGVESISRRYPCSMQPLSCLMEEALMR